MRIAFVTTSFPVADHSASGIFVERLVAALSRRHELEVITPAATKPIDRRADGYAVKAFRYAPWSVQRLAHQPGGVPVALRSTPWLRLLVPAFLAAMLWACWRACRRCDLLHANWAPTGVVAGLAALPSGQPVVTTIRGEDTARLEKSLLSRLSMRLCLRLSRRVICVSEGMAASLAARFPRYAGKIDFIGNGVSDEFLAVPPVADVREPLNFVIIGSLIPRKGVDTAVRAMSMLAESHRQRLRCRVIGDGPEENPLRHLAAGLGVEACFEFAGPLPPERVPEALAHSDALLICSHHEGRPNVVIEAMAAARPIIGTTLPGIQELVRDAQEGLLFAPGDAKGLAAALIKMLDDQGLRARLAANARARVHALKLTWPGAVTNYEAVYSAAIQGAASA